MLPGGVLVAVPSGTQPAGSPTATVWSYPNIHGDVLALADASGVKQGTTRRYDPNGSALSVLPDNMPGTADYGWEGSNQRLHEHAGTLSTIEMGARPYQPKLGIFLAVDPVDGGSAHDYDYGSADPVNNEDLDGRMVSSDGGSGGFIGPVVVEPDHCTATSTPYSWGVTPQDVAMGLVAGNGGALGGLGKGASALGRTMRTSEDAAARSSSARWLPTVGTAAKNPIAKWAGSARGTASVTIIGASLTASAHIMNGDSVGVTVGGTVGSTGLAMAGAWAGGLACGALAASSGGVGGLACPFMIGGLSAVGGIVGDKLGGWVGSWF